MTEIKKKSSEELAKLLDEKREEVRSFRFGVAGAAKKNVKAPLLARKEIARILTEQSSRLTASHAQAGLPAPMLRQASKASAAEITA